jgi:hypothetical protein
MGGMASPYLGDHTFGRLVVGATVVGGAVGAFVVGPGGVVGATVVGGAVGAFVVAGSNVVDADVGDFVVGADVGIFVVGARVVVGGTVDGLCVVVMDFVVVGLLVVVVGQFLLHL